MVAFSAFSDGQEDMEPVGITQQADAIRVVDVELYSAFEVEKRLDGAGLIHRPAFPRRPRDDMFVGCAH